MTRPSAPYLRGQRIDPKATTGKETVAELVDNAFLAYNAGRLREGCQLFTQRMLEPDVTVVMTLTSLWALRCTGGRPTPMTLSSGTKASCGSTTSSSITVFCSPLTPSFA